GLRGRACSEGRPAMLGALLAFPEGPTANQALRQWVATFDRGELQPAFVCLRRARCGSGGTRPRERATRASLAAADRSRDSVGDGFEVTQAESGGALTTLLADGGATRNDFLMQFQADLLGCPVIRSESPDVSALGAAYLAGLAVGLWTSEAAIAALPREREQF